VGSDAPAARGDAGCGGPRPAAAACAARRCARQIGKLSALGGSYLQSMASASTKSAAFSQRLPDGIWVPLFDGLALTARWTSPRPAPPGLRNAVSLRQVQGLLDPASKAQAG
jgi:hypothetical protein